jgi:hypothetical protein
LIGKGVGERVGRVALGDGEEVDIIEDGACRREESAIVQEKLSLGNRVSEVGMAEERKILLLLEMSVA